MPSEPAGVPRPGRRDFDKPHRSDVLDCIKADIALYEEAQDPGDLVDALEGIREILCRLCGEKP